jgi:penicillin amidase
MQRQRIVRAVLSAVILAIVLHAGARRTGPMPPLGPLLDPVNGVWAVAAGAESPDREAFDIPGLAAPVQIVFDDRGVPHIFASSSEDAARALGYVVARDRLFQMEMRWRTAAGRLAELAGEDAVGFDRRMRRLGLAWSAERDFAALDPASAAVREVSAYAEGVNAWIDQLDRRDVPFEFRLLGAEPSRWEPVFSLYLLKLMGWDLTYGLASDLRRLRAQAMVGKQATDALAPVNSPIQQPIQANGQTSHRFDISRIPPPGRPDLAARERVSEIEVALGLLPDDRAGEPEPTVLGSNNWAVAPERTAAGYALLAGDPHLGLSLPSTWYEAHLVVPGELDVYGVTFPSVPSIVIGFNRDIAWSFTNTGADVIDYYEEEFDDPNRPTRYRVDGEWRELARRVEAYRDRGGAVLAVDTFLVTHRGPVVTHEDRPLSMRWIVLEGSGSTDALWKAARAASVEEYLAAMEGFAAPAQNMIVADRSGTIAIRSNGYFPLHPDGLGLEVRDGRTSSSDWVGFWPLSRYPFSIDPDQGYLASASQRPIVPRVDPTYLGADWLSPWRAIRINALLAADSAVTPDAMRRFQTDPVNARAEIFVPFFSEAVDRLAQDSEATDAAREAARLLAEWDLRYTKQNERAVLFEYAMNELATRTWDELLAEREVGPARRVYTPASAVLASLLHQPESIWWDDRRTPEVEDRDAILIASLMAGLERARREHGEPNEGGWRWAGIRHANIYHLLGLPSLSALDLPVQGGPGNLNPSSGGGTHGASWRMVVEMGPEVRAWSIYPGGQSGNPVSPRYRDRIEKWVNGELDPVRFPFTAADLDSSAVSSTLELNPER